LTLHLKIATDGKYYPEILELASELHKNSVYKDIAFDKTSFDETFVRILNSPKEDGSIILLMDDIFVAGFLVCSHMTHMWNKSEKTAVELAFWIKPEYKSFKAIKMILGAYRYWARKIGCNSLLMGKLTNPDEVETYKIRRL
jgi:hypothetical protein